MKITFYYTAINKMSLISLFRLLFIMWLQENLSYHVAGVHVSGSAAPSPVAPFLTGSEGL